jgi:hypothetical protein
VSKEGEPSVVIPAIAIVGVIVGTLFAAQAISQSRARRAATAPTAGAPAR